MIRSSVSDGVLTIDVVAGELAFTELAAELRALLRRHPDKAVVLVGSGSTFVVPRVFRSRAESDSFAILLADLGEHRMPVIAAADAPVLGWAVDLVLAADYRIARTGVVVGEVSAPDASRYGPALVSRLCRLAGHAVATRLLLLDECLTVGVDGALSYFISEVTEPIEIAAQRHAQLLSRGAPLALEAIKVLLTAGTELPFAAGLALEADMSSLLLPARDRAEGLAAHREKRPAVFSGE